MPAAEEIAEGRRHRGGILLEEVGEEIEVVDAIRLRHSHVVARPLEACEASRAVAHGAHASALDALAQELRHGMEAEDVPDLEHPWGRAHDVRQRARPSATVSVRGFSTKQCFPAPQALTGERQMIVGGCDNVHRVHLGQRVAEVRHRPRLGHPRLDGEGPALRRHVGDPELAAQLAQDTEVLLSPAPQADQEAPSRAVAPSPPTSSATS